MKTVICLTSVTDKITRVTVEKKIVARGINFIPINIDEISNNYVFSYNTRGEFIEFNSVQFNDNNEYVVWNRKSESSKIKRLINSASKLFPSLQARDFFLLEYRSVISNYLSYFSDYFWLDNPAKVQGANNKLKNLSLARSLGFSTPETIISNKEFEILEFAKLFSPDIIIKPFNSFEIVNENRLSHVISRRVDYSQIEINSKIISCAPVFLQQYIKKKIELRVTIVGQKVFSVAIFSQEHERAIEDWRNAPLSQLKYEIYDLPSEVNQKLLEFNKRLNLNFSTFDLIETPEGELVFLECNPQGEWYWLEEITNIKISEAICNLLIDNLSSS